MRIMVTGGAGFIGSALCRYLISQTKHDVLNVDKLTYAGNLANVADLTKNIRYIFKKADICHGWEVKKILQGFKPDVVFHLAAESHVDRSIEEPSAFMQTNVLGTFTLLETVGAYFETLTSTQKKKFRFIHVSTDEVYGSVLPGDKRVEEDPYDPNSPYAASKAGADHLVRAWYKTYGLPVIMAHSTNNYGPFCYPEKLIPLTVINGLCKKSLPVYGDGEQVRDWMHVDDHVGALYQILRKGVVGESYNISANHALKNIDLVRKICKHLDEISPDVRAHEELITFVEDRLGHDFCYSLDTIKIEKEIGWKPKIDFEKGLKETVSWYAKHQDWWAPALRTSEQKKVI